MADDEQPPTIIVRRLTQLAIFSALLSVTLLLWPPRLPADAGTASTLFQSPLQMVMIGATITFTLLLNLRSDELKISPLVWATGLGTLLLVGPELADPSPLGPDGHYFLTLSIWFERLGSAGMVSGYLERPGILLFLLPFISAGLDVGVVALVATMITIGLSITWIYIILSAIEERTDTTLHRWLPFTMLFLAGVGLAWWNPVQFSPMLLALVLHHILVHRMLKRETLCDLTSLLLISVLAITHLFMPLLTATVMFWTGRRRDIVGRRARWLGLFGLITWMIWNIGVATENTLTVGAKLIDFDGVVVPGLVGIAVCFVALEWAHRGVDHNEVPSQRGIRPRDELIGLLLFFPLLIAMDITTGAPRFSPRVVMLAAVPIGVGLIHLAKRSGIDEYLRHPFSKQAGVVAILLSLICSIALVQAQTLWAGRTPALSHEALGCWEMAEDAGLAGVEGLPGERRFILHSPMTAPPIDDGDRWWYQAAGDGGGWSPELNSYAALIWTADMPARMSAEGATPLDSAAWELVASSPACSIYVHPSAISALTPGVSL